MSTSTIRQYATDAITNQGVGSYVREPSVQRILDSLEQREESVITGLIAAAGSLGLPQDQSEALLQEVGLMAAPPAPEPAVEDSAGDNDAPGWFKSAFKGITDRLDRAGL